MDMDILDHIYESSANNRIYGMGSVTVEEIIDFTQYQIEDILRKNELDDIEIVELSICGSRINENPHKNADLDILLYYRGNISSKKIFYTLHKADYIKQLTYDGVYIDIKPEQIILPNNQQ